MGVAASELQVGSESPKEVGSFTQDGGILSLRGRTSWGFKTFCFWKFALSVTAEAGINDSAALGLVIEEALLVEPKPITAVPFLPSITGGLPTMDFKVFLF